MPNLTHRKTTWGRYAGASATSWVTANERAIVVLATRLWLGLVLRERIGAFAQTEADRCAGEIEGLT